MYSLIPEKFLPTDIIDNVSYYPDGTYKISSGTYRFMSNPAGSVNYIHVLLPPDNVDSTGQPTNSISGFRTVRNIRIHIDLEGVMKILRADTNPYKVASGTVGLAVQREAVSTISDRDILDQHIFTTLFPVDYTAASDYHDREEDSVDLSYAGTIKLYSGDRLQLQFNFGSDADIAHGGFYVLYGTFTWMYDVKFN